MIIPELLIVAILLYFVYLFVFREGKLFLYQPYDDFIDFCVGIFLTYLAIPFLVVCAALFWPITIILFIIGLIYYYKDYHAF